MQIDLSETLADRAYKVSWIRANVPLKEKERLYVLSNEGGYVMFRREFSTSVFIVNHDAARYVAVTEIL